MTSDPASECMTEQEAAQSLGITLDALYRILDEHIFNNGTPRPKGLRFTSSDLLLLAVWADEVAGSKVLSMPKRN